MAMHPAMARIHLPEPGRPAVIIEAERETSLAALEREEVIALYKAHGALLLRGFGAGLDQFGTFVRQFCSTSVDNESPGRELLDPGQRIQSVNLGDLAFSLHPELSREPWKPDVAFFGCLSAPGRGGETTICDGVELVKALRTEVREGLENRRLVYLMPTWPGLFEFWLGTPEPSAAQLASPPPSCPYSFVRTPDGRIARMFSRPALHRPMFAAGPAFGNFLLFARFNNDLHNFPLLDDLRPVPEAWLQAIRATGEALSYPVAWQQGDVVMLDNTRFMHGRRAITDPAERRIATYFGYLDFALPDPEEPPQAPWRSADFTPPQPPGLAG